MNHRPQSWEELRRNRTDESTVEMPDELRALVNDEPHPERRAVFLDRSARDTLDAGEGGTLEGYRPPWVSNSFLPRRARAAIPPTVRHHGHRLEPAIIYQPDERKTYNDRSYPWGCVCKITTASGFVGSGVLIGPRHVLTASHCVEWATTKAEKVQVHLTGNTAAATAFAIHVYYFTKISGDPTLTTLDEDYACLVLDQRLGDAFGYLGVKQYDSAWDGDNVWSSMGYPTDIAGGRQPTYIKNKSMDEDEFDLGSGRAMTTSADMCKGQSGAPMFAWWDGDPYVVAVMSAYGEIWASGMENWCAGGADLVHVVRAARDGHP